MSTQQYDFLSLLENAKRLPVEQQLEIIGELSHSLQRALKPQAVKLGGLWKGLDIRDEEIDEVRREMWSNQVK